MFTRSTQFVEKKDGTIITWPVSDLYPSIPQAGGLSIVVEWNESVGHSPSFRFHGQLLTLGMKYPTSAAHFTLYAFFMVSFSKAGKQDRNSTGRRWICCHGCDFKTKLSVCECMSITTETYVIIRDCLLLFPMNNYFPWTVSTLSILCFLLAWLIG